MKNYSYAHEKFGTAVQSLATSSSSIQDRLHSAFMSFHPVQARDFKEPEVREAYEEIMQRLTAVKDDPHSLGTVRVTLNQMSDHEASEIAQLICDFYLVHLDDEIRKSK
jgi:hypothetical protein